MQLVKAFTQLQIKKIPSKYILKRYSRDARSIVGWDRNDIVRGGRDGSEEETRFVKLVPLMMGLARAGSKSEYRCDETWTRGTSLKELIETIPTNVARAGAGVGCSTDAAEDDVEETCVAQIALLEAPMSQTKGRGTKKYGNRSAAGADHPSTSTYNRKRIEGGMEIIGER
jgi:hypothetical protein